MTREEALELLHEYTRGESLRRHALAVEAAMRAYAQQRGADEETWAITGLLHDFDYDRCPEAPGYPTKGVEILDSRGGSEDIRRPILGHAT